MRNGVKMTRQDRQENNKDTMTELCRCDESDEVMKMKCQNETKHDEMIRILFLVKSSLAMNYYD